MHQSLASETDWESQCNSPHHHDQNWYRFCIPNLANCVFFRSFGVHYSQPVDFTAHDSRLVNEPCVLHQCKVRYMYFSYNSIQVWFYSQCAASFSCYRWLLTAWVFAGAHASTILYSPWLGLIHLLVKIEVGMLLFFAVVVHLFFWLFVCLFFFFFFLFSL